MNNEEAKFILGGYRPGGRDAGDAMFEEALRQAQRDPALGAWFARQQAYDSAVAAKLAEVAPPAGLREAVLAGARMSGGRRGRWRQPAGLAAAAALAVLIVGAAAFWPKRGEARPDPLVSFALVDALEGSKHGGHGGPMAALQAELGEKDTRLGQRLPVEFAKLESTGCRALAVEGRAVLEVCFKREGKWYHCYIARCEDFPVLAAKQGPAFAASDKITALMWADGAHRFVVAGPADQATLARFL